MYTESFSTTNWHVYNASMQTRLNCTHFFSFEGNKKRLSALWLYTFAYYGIEKLWQLIVSVFQFPRFHHMPHSKGETFEEGTCLVHLHVLTRNVFDKSKMLWGFKQKVVVLVTLETEAVRSITQLKSNKLAVVLDTAQICPYFNTSKKSQQIVFNPVFMRTFLWLKGSCKKLFTTFRRFSDYYFNIHHASTVF